MKEGGEVNQLLATKDTNNWKLAFKLLEGQPELLKESYPLFMWVIRSIGFSSMGFVYEEELRDELLAFKTLISQQDKAFMNELANCKIALNIFFQDIGWYDSDLIIQAFANYEPYREIYESFLAKDLVQPYEFIVTKCEQNGMKTLLGENAYPFYRFLLIHDCFDLSTKLAFVEILKRALSANKEKYATDIQLAMDCLDEAIQTNKEKAYEYNFEKGYLTTVYLDNKTEGNKLYQLAVEGREKEWKENPEGFKNLLDLINLLFFHKKDLDQAYRYIEIGCESFPENVEFKLYYGKFQWKKFNNIEGAIAILEEILEKEPSHYSTKIWLDVIKAYRK